MAANVGNLFSAADFNAVVAKITKVLGDDGVDQEVGYGRNVRSSTVDGNTLITAALMDDLYADLAQARAHQKGTSFSWDTSADGLNAPDTGEYIGAFAADIGPGGTSVDAAADEDEGFLDFEQAAQDILDDIYNVGGDQTSVQTLETVSRTTAWNGTITTVADIVFTNANERRYFFNSGGYIQFDAGLTGGNSVAGDQTATYPDNPAYQKDEIWQTMLNTMGSIRLSRTGTTSTGSGTAQAIGNYDLTTSYQTIFQKDGSGVYSENYYRIEAKASTNKITFRIRFVDADLGDNRDADAGFPGEGTPVDENVTGTITSTISSRAATGSLGISHPGSATISDLSGGASTSYVLTTNDSTVNEGSSVTISLATTGVSNGTLVPYTISGVSTSDISLGSLTGNFTVSSGAASLTFTIENDTTTEGAETLTLSLNNGQASVDIDIADSSLSPGFSVSASTNSADEGSTVTFTLNSTNVNPGTFGYTITGINAADISAGALTGTITTVGDYSQSSGTTSITLANDAATEGQETITFTAESKSVQVTVNDTSTTGASSWPTVPLSGWGSNAYDQSASGGNYTAQSFASLTLTNDLSNNRVTVSGYTGDNGATVTPSVGYVTYTGYANPTIEVRYFQSNVSITSVGDTDSLSPAERANTPLTSGTWYTLANNVSEQFFWIAEELRYLGLTQGQGGAYGASVAIVSADSVSFEVRISEAGKPTITRTSPIKSVNLSADLFTGDLQ